MDIEAGITAIWNQDIATLRSMFEDIVGLVGDDYAGMPCWLALGGEICEALSDDVRPMPGSTCNQLGVVAGTTYARGADRMRPKLLKRLKYDTWWESDDD